MRGMETQLIPQNLHSYRQIFLVEGKKKGRKKKKLQKEKKKNL
jgi:hypothetical protein